MSPKLRGIPEWLRQANHVGERDSTEVDVPLCRCEIQWPASLESRAFAPPRIARFEPNVWRNRCPRLCAICARRAARSTRCFHDGPRHRRSIRSDATRDSIASGDAREAPVASRIVSGTSAALICQSLTRRRSWAFTATTTVLSDISAAPSAAGGTMPHGASAPAARGIANMLYPAAHHRF